MTSNDRKRNVKEENFDEVDTIGLCPSLCQFLYEALLDACASYPSQQALTKDKQEELHHLAFSQMEQWASRTHNPILLNEHALLKHKRLYSIMSYTKDGEYKENKFFQWCRKINRLRNKINRTATVHAASGTATEHAASSTATEHDAPSEQSDDSLWFKPIAFELLSNELLPWQRIDKKYKIRRNNETGDIHITQPQRSWINSMLFQNMGDTKVAYFICNHGIPLLFDAPFHCSPFGVPSLSLLQRMLAEAMCWHASLLHSLVRHECHEGMETARSLADLNQAEWRRKRQTAKHDAKELLVLGERLSMEKEVDKRKYDDMSASEQQAMEDFENKELHKLYDATKIKKMPKFKGVLFTSEEDAKEKTSFQ